MSFISRKMVVDAKTIGEIEKQDRLYEAAKGKIISRIKNNVEMAIKKLDLAGRELLEEVEIEFGENPFAKLLEKINSRNPPTDAEVRSVLDKRAPQDFGPSEKAFYSLLEEIEAFKSWRVKKAEKPSSAAPSNIRTEYITRDSISLAWDDDWRATSYQVEVNGSKSLERVLTNIYTTGGLLPGTEYTFRIRSVRGDSVSEWSNDVKERIEWDCVWKKCPGHIFWNKKYSVDEKNPRIATMINNGNCTAIGNTPLPPNKVTSWSIKILRSKWNNGAGTDIGIAPSNIDQNGNENYNKCGWYFSCFYSKLCSGPPHNYFKWKEYGPRKRDGEYVHDGGSVGVIMDTSKGELSFALDGVNLGVAFKGIPLDKPLVPCAIFWYGGNSVELVT